MIAAEEVNGHNPLQEITELAKNDKLIRSYMKRKENLMLNNVPMYKKIGTDSEYVYKPNIQIKFDELNMRIKIRIAKIQKNIE